jgi:hypothetical protein
MDNDRRDTIELLSIEEMSRMTDLLRAFNPEVRLPGCQSCVIKGEVFWQKEDFLASLQESKFIGPNIPCCNAAQLRCILGYTDDNFPPSYRHNGREFWEGVDVERHLAERHPAWKKSDIENHVTDSLRICR